MIGRSRLDAPEEKETGRLESFSDGVFAVAITLLVLNLVVPELGSAPTAASLATALAANWPEYLAFVTSFSTILIMWINHHGIFKLVQRIDSLFMFANGFLLLLVTAVPFVTGLVARYLTTPAAPTAAAVYAATFSVVDIAYYLLWRSIAHERGLLRVHVPKSRVDSLTRSSLLAFPVYVGATALAFWNAYASVGVCFCLWVVWAITGWDGPTRSKLPVNAEGPPAANAAG